MNVASVIVRLAIQNFYYKTILQSGVTPLMVASEQGHLPVVKTLLKHKATIGFKDEVRNMFYIMHNLTSGKLSM